MTTKAVTELLEIIADMPGEIAVEQKSLLEELKSRASEPNADLHAELKVKWKAGRSERIESTRNRWDDFDTKRGYAVETSAQVNLMNQRCAVTLEDAKTFALFTAQKAIDNTCDIMVNVLVKSLEPILKRIKTLEAQLEQRKYFGIWDSGEYKRHNMVTHAGSLWIALSDTTGKPGETDDWQLAVKRGRDGRDER
jgi:hypothetical protein